MHHNLFHDGKPPFFLFLLFLTVPNESICFHLSLIEETNLPLGLLKKTDIVKGEIYLKLGNRKPNLSLLKPENLKQWQFTCQYLDSVIKMVNEKLTKGK